MLRIWKTHNLKVVSSNENKIIVDAQEHGHIEIENNDLVYTYKEGQEIDVFLYYDKDKNVTGYHGSPLAEPNQFAYLKLVSNSKVGAFFDWGMDKDLFCPFAEQKTRLEPNKYYLVYIYIDEITQRVLASTKISKFISPEIDEDITEAQQVKALIINKTPLGYNAVVENKYQGLIYKNEVFKPLEVGTTINAIIHKIRENNKIDLRVFKNDGKDIAEFEKKIIDYLEQHNGSMLINDDSKPEVIYKTFGISKKNFKKALGGLYKKGIVDLSTKKVKLISGK